ncbi:MAG: cysteine desulfurase CsdA [Planctomycetes bacterium]|nr:cysteine desulfurase CsdA [Planctomycetota bacterium]
MTATFDAEAIRRDFPILGKRFRGKRLAYLDNAATSQKPTAVIEALVKYYRESNSNVHRGVYALAEEAEAAYLRARKIVGAHLNVEPDEIVFVRGTTEALNLVAQSHARPNLQPGDVIVLTTMEHHANLVPWQLVAEQTEAEIKVAPIDSRGCIDRNALSALLDQKPKILSFCHVSNSLGTVNPAAEIVNEAKERGIVTVIDGAQSIPHGPVDLKALDCDFFAFSGHKAFGPMGIGVLYGKGERLASMPPYQGGGDMVDCVSFEKTTYAPPPQRFEAGTPNVAGAIGLGAALEYLSELDLEGVAVHEKALLEQATAELEAIPGLTIHGQAPEKAAVVSFTVEGIHPHDLATFLDAEGVAVRAGHHCCQPLMKHLDEPATVRASFALYNLPEEVDLLVKAVRKTIDCFR